jgi:hypothetical protein
VGILSRRAPWVKILSRLGASLAAMSIVALVTACGADGASAGSGSIGSAQAGMIFAVLIMGAACLLAVALMRMVMALVAWLTSLLAGIIRFAVVLGIGAAVVLTVFITSSVT